MVDAAEETTLEGEFFAGCPEAGESAAEDGLELGEGAAASGLAPERLFAATAWPETGACTAFAVELLALPPCA